MTDLLLSGDILYPHGPEEGWVHVKGGRIHEVSRGELPELDGGHLHFEGVVIPGLIDLHTHMGDHLARGSVPDSLEAAVYPGGYKHQMLEKATFHELVSSIRSSIKELEPGVTTALDFREGGSEGIRALRKASGRSGMNVIGLGRPYKGENWEEVLSISDGFGIPSVVPGLGDVRDLAKRSGKLFAIHASEGERDDIGTILDLEPDLLVHMVKGTRKDREAISEMSIPVAVCPRSNRYFGLDLPLEKMLDDEMKLGFGTDNSMTSVQNMFAEMRAGLDLLQRSRGDIEERAREVFGMAAGKNLENTVLLEKISNGVIWGDKDWLRVGDAPLISVIRTPEGDNWMDKPFSHIVKFSDQADVLYTGRI